ncbi:MAG: hypothetical protein K2O30_10440 [Duncaniella sp.]|nr:hypothetical protein [Duncaniella sp.]
MRIDCLTPERYRECFPYPSHFYNTVEFSELNRYKCDNIHYLSFKDDTGKIRLGIILGEREGVLLSPFSAPFGGFEESGKQRLCYYIDAVEALKCYAEIRGLGLVISIPPPIYNRDSHISKQFGAMANGGYKLVCSDYDYYFPSDVFGRIDERLGRNARKNLAKATAAQYGFIFSDASDMNIIERVYDVIKCNRESLGYILRLSIDAVKDTIRLVDADFMLLTDGDKDVAAAMAYHVSERIVQIIYWGHKPEYSSCRPMNLLAYKVIEFYAAKGIIIDVGPSSSDGVPALGLCDFKEGVGCDILLKHTFSFNPRI